MRLILRLQLVILCSLNIVTADNVRYTKDIVSSAIVSNEQKQSLCYLSLEKYIEFGSVPSGLGVFTLLKSPGDEIIWQEYDSYGGLPGTKWLFDTASYSENRLYIVMGKARSLDLELRIYEVDATKVLTDPVVILEKNGELKELHPELRPIPISVYDTEFGECNADRISVIAERRSLLISAEKSSSLCPYVYYRYDLTSKKWTSVSIAEVPSGN